MVALSGKVEREWQHLLLLMPSAIHNVSGQQTEVDSREQGVGCRVQVGYAAMQVREEGCPHFLRTNGKGQSINAGRPQEMGIMCSNPGG